MEYRRLGRSNIEVSCLALGGNIFGRFCDGEGTVAIMNAAQDLGINVVDTADVYSDGVSEELVGAVIRNRRHWWIVASKVGVRSGESPAGKGRRDCIVERAEKSLRRLNTDYIDLYQMHHFDPSTPVEETLDALNSLVQQGKVRSVGASNYSAEQLSHSLSVSQAMKLPTFASIQLPYNMMKRYVEQSIFPICTESQVNVIAYATLGRGVLAGRYKLGFEPQTATRASVSPSVRADLTSEVLTTVEDLAAFARHRGISVGTLALSWVLGRPEVATALVGVRSVEQLLANGAAADWRLPPSELSELDLIIGKLDRYRTLALGGTPSVAR